MRLIAIFFFALWLAGCGPAGEKSETFTQTNTASSEAHGNAPATTGVLAGAPVVLEGCYEMTMQNDTARLVLQVHDTTVSGSLQYAWFEKDRNTGTLRGVLRDSLIVADYFYHSEGRSSVREVVFKIIDTTLLQGFGDLDERNGKVVFRNPAQLQYLKEYPFVKVPCP